MAGHSEWANSKHRKAAQDARRGNIFTKLIRELAVAARQGGPEPADDVARTMSSTSSIESLRC